MKIYQAGPLFTEAEQAWHRKFKHELEQAGHTVVWPGDLITQADLDAWGREAPVRIMETDRDALLACDAVVALLDGTQIDDGTAWEIGYSYAKDIPVIGIRTDFRRAGDSEYGSMNAMIEGSLFGLARDLHGCLELLDQLKKV